MYTVVCARGMLIPRCYCLKRTVRSHEDQRRNIALYILFSARVPYCVTNRTKAAITLVEDTRMYANIFCPMPAVLSPPVTQSKHLQWQPWIPTRLPAHHGTDGCPASAKSFPTLAKKFLWMPFSPNSLLTTFHSNTFVELPDSLIDYIGLKLKYFLKINFII